MAIVSVQNLHKQFGPIQALQDINFVVHQGEIFGLVGPPGAGKSTAIKILVGLLPPDFGWVQVLRCNPILGMDALRERIGIQLKFEAYDNCHRVIDYVQLVASCYKRCIGHNWLMQSFDLNQIKNRRVKELTNEEFQRLILALAFTNDPEILFLDEPTANLSIQWKHQLWKIIKGARNWGCSIILTTQDLGEACQLCHRVAILEKGQIIAMGNPRHLHTQFPEIYPLYGGGILHIGG